MFKYKNTQKELRQYKATKIKHGESKSGAKYTIFTICDNKKVGEKDWVNNYYQVFVNGNLDVNENDMVVLKDIEGVNVEEKEWQGKKLLNKTIYADVEVVVSSAPKPIDNPFEGEDDEFPF